MHVCVATLYIYHTMQIIVGKTLWNYSSQNFNKEYFCEFAVAIYVRTSLVQLTSKFTKNACDALCLKKF